MIDKNVFIITIIITANYLLAYHIYYYVGIWETGKTYFLIP